MKPLSIIFLCFLVIPTAEIYLLIQIGQVIGAGWTIFGVVATAVIGAWLIKLQGILTFFRAKESLRAGEVPAIELIEGLFLLVAAAFLITPGFVTDTLGFLCLISAVRRPLATIVLKHAFVHIQGTHDGNRTETYDVNYREINHK